jgi:hypothetical protein
MYPAPPLSRATESCSRVAPVPVGVSFSPSSSCARRAEGGGGGRRGGSRVVSLAATGALALGAVDVLLDAFRDLEQPGTALVDDVGLGILRKRRPVHGLCGHERSVRRFSRRI